MLSQAFRKEGLGGLEKQPQFLSRVKNKRHSQMGQFFHGKSLSIFPHFFFSLKIPFLHANLIYLIFFFFSHTFLLSENIIQKRNYQNKRHFKQLRNKMHLKFLAIALHIDFSKNLKYLCVLLWCHRLRLRNCLCSRSGHCCDMGSVLGLVTSTCCGQGKK